MDEDEKFGNVAVVLFVLKVLKIADISGFLFGSRWVP